MDRSVKPAAANKKGASRLCLAAPVIAAGHIQIVFANGAWAVRALSVMLRGPLGALLLVLGWREERRQGFGGGVRGVPEIGQAKGGFNRLQ